MDNESDFHGADVGGGRPRGHDHYHMDTDAEGHPLVESGVPKIEIGSGTTPRTRLTGGAVVVSSGFEHTAVVTE